MDNDQMRAMYNSFGTLNRPQSYGDDLYNDRENIIPAQPATQTGEDEAGNPIMAPVEMPEASNKPILNNVIDVVSDVVTTPGAFSGQVGPIGTMTDTVANYIMGNDEQRQQILDRMQRYTPQGIESGIKSVIHSMSNATELEHTKLYENYFYNAEKKNAEIKRIANLLQIDENAFAHNRELYQKAALAADRVERMGKFKKYQDAEGNIDMAKIYADVPGLAEVQQKQGTAAAALALGNIDGIQSINEVYDNAFSRFAGSVYAGARRGYIADRRSAIWNAARKENRLPTAEEQAKLDEYDAELRTLPKYNYNTVGNVAGAMIGGAAENLAMIVKSQGAGAVAGVVAGRVGGAKAAEIARNAVSTYMMAQDIAGSQYEELVNKTDANGRPMYTPEQASWLALSQGVGEAVLEQWSLNQMGKAIFGRSAAKSITEIIKNSPTIDAAKAGIRDYAALKLTEAGKAGLISLGSEAFEEFTQQASDMLMENMAQVMLKGKDADITSVEDILASSTGQMIEALPAIGGFGLIGFGANPIANTRAVLGFRSNVRNVVNNKVLIGRMANAHYGEVLDGVWKNKGNIKELQDKAPESVTTILDTQNRLAGMEDGFIDVRELSKENADLVDKIAEANNISKDELAACLDGSGMLQVKTSTLMQMDLKDEQHKAIRDNVTTSLDAFTTAQENNAIKLVKEQMDSLQAFNDKTYKQAVENIIQARFPDAEQAKLAREIIEANYDNPQEEFKRRLDAVNAEMDEYIAPVLAELRSGMKQGVDIIRMEGDRDASYVKQSNNADWYRNYYADYGRAPNAEELRGLAIDIASGRQNNRYGLVDYQNNTDESREYFGNVAETLDRLEEQREALMSIQDRMRDLNPGEMVATASLSKEGLKVYDTMRQMMGESENKDVKKAGAFNALFLARYADNMAKAISKARNIPYTAEDFVRDRFRIDVNAEYNDELMAAQLFQVSPAEFNRQKEAVRKQYENTDEWLKAPNGEDTNLTEDQWVTVRTDAFKNWFGDWEGNPAEASKVVDENGEPLVVYHGTKKKFDTFEKQKIGTGVSKKTKGGNHFGSGFYFTPTYFDAQKFGRNVLEVFLNIKNPASSEYGLKEDSDGIIASGFNGREYVTFEPNQIKDATGRNVGFDPQSGNIYLQEAAPERDLVAYHNMSENSVLRSAALGGLPVPSIAVTRKDIPFDQFGEITLIGGSDIVDPANNYLNEVFSRDAWTVTFPKTVYDKVKSKDVSALLNTFKSSFLALGDEGRREASELDYVLNEGESIDNAKYKLSNQLAVMYHYVTQVLGKPVKVPFEKVKGRYDYLLKHKEIRDMVNEMRYDYVYNDEMKERFSKAVRPYIEAEMKKEYGDKAQPYIDVFFTQDGFFNRNFFDSLVYDLRDYGKTKLNERKLKAELKKKIKEADYEKFIDEQINTLYKNPQIMVGKKRMPITLDNIVAAMSALRGAGKQESLTYGDNKALAAMSKKFKSLDELRKKKSNLTTQEKANLAVQTYKEKADEYREVVGSHYKWNDSWDKWDDANKALVMAAKNGGSESAIRTALLRNDFENIDDVVIDAAKEVINAAKDMQTDYFEAKPLRAVGFNEFSAAVVPNGTSKETIDYLKSQGIAVTKYNPKVEGDRQAKTQKAAEKAKVYFQQGRTAKGAISLTQQGQKIISLFESADQSTFVHEMAHMFLLDLQEIAGIDRESQQAKDLDTIMKWAEYKPGQADEYKGTASAEEFRKREQAIKEAEAKGDTAEARRLKDVWAQERFARAFEEYLKSGEAPAQGLKRAFRAFKKWLVQIYNDVLGAGVRATPEVEAVMARMVASEEEIDAMEAANSIARKVVDMGNMPQIAADKLKEMQTEAKEEAKERMLKRLIRDYENNNLKDLNEKLKVVRKDAREELKNLPCFVVQKLLDEGLDMEAALDIGEFASEQEYKDALEQAGGTLDKAVYRAVKEAKQNILGQMPSKQQLYDMAEEALNSGIHNTEMSEIEAGIMESLKEEYNNVTAKLRRAFEEIDTTLDKEASAEMLEALKKSIRNLKYAERWGAQEFVLIKEFENAANTLDEVDREAVERLREKYEQIKEKTLRNKEWINGIIDANKGMAKVIRDEAGRRLNDETVSVATNPRYWRRQALSSAKRAWDGLKKIRKGQRVDYEDAVRDKRQQAIYEAMEAQAYENKKKYDKWMNGRDGFKAKAKRMSNPKFKADSNLRYYYNHLLYIYGIRTADAVAPTSLKSITDVLNDLRESQQLGVEPPVWIITAANSTDPGKTYQQLTMSELEQLKKTTDMFYKLATVQNSLFTSDDSLDTVESECALDYANQVGYEGVGNQRINEVKGAMGSYMTSMIKSERFLAWLGGEHGAHIKRIYRTLFDAAENEEMEQEKEAKYLRDLYNKHYTKQELRAILNDGIPGLSIGADTKITKENIICMALNWGNELNRARLAVGLFNCETDRERIMREAELFQIIQDNMTENDWKFVQEMWDHIDSFANPVSHVLETMIGIPLTRLKRQAFEVQTKDGKVLRLAGGYYPIVKDSGKSTKQSEFEQIEEAKQIGGISVMGTGMGTTKERDASLMLNQGPLKLNLDVAHRHIEQQIHIITMRMAVRDAYKILNSKTVKGEIEGTFGTEVMKSLNEWVLASWAAPIRTGNRVEQLAASLRSGSIGAIMAYRASTALLNFANIVYMANEIGPINAVNAVIEFYKHPVRNREAIMAASVYMRNRATNMDRDLGAQNKAILKRHEGLLGKAENAVDKATGGKTEEVGYLIDKYANKLIEETDMFFSLPLYWWQFRQTYDAELAKEGVTEEEARDTANFEATRRVTKVFPSSRKIDSSEVQRSRSEFVKLLTPFFSFSNTMMNAVWNKYYEGKYNGRVVLEDENGNPVLNENGDPVYTSAKKGFIRRYWRFAMAFFMDFMVGAFFETLLRQVPDALAGTGGGGDEDDEFGIGWFKVNKKKYMHNALDSITGGFYGLNAMIDLGKVATAITEGKSTYGGGRNIGVLSGTVERGTKAFVDLALMLNGSDKIDMLDFMRDASKVYTAKTGFSDTLTDAFFNTMRFATDEGYSMTNMADLREYIAKTIFDRKLKKK